MPPSGLVSFSISPSNGVDAGEFLQFVRRHLLAIVTPFEPPISGLRWRSTLVGRFNFTCLVLMTCPS